MVIAPLLAALVPTETVLISAQLLRHRKPYVVVIVVLLFGSDGRRKKLRTECETVGPARVRGVRGRGERLGRPGRSSGYKPVKQ